MRRRRMSNIFNIFGIPKRVDAIEKTVADLQKRVTTLEKNNPSNINTQIEIATTVLNKAGADLKALAK